MNVSLKQQLQCSLINMRRKDEEKIRIKSVAHCRQPHAVIFVDIIVFFICSSSYHKNVTLKSFSILLLFSVHFLCSSGAKGTEIEVKYMNGKSYKK
jgi:hypothetical protein